MVNTKHVGCGLRNKILRGVHKRKAKALKTHTSVIVKHMAFKYGSFCRPYDKIFLPYNFSNVYFLSLYILYSLNANMLIDRPEFKNVK